MVKQRVVQPGGHLDLRVLLVGEVGRVRKGLLGVQLGEGLVDEVAVVEDGAVGGLVRRIGLVDVGVLAFAVVDHVGGVVGDDVEEHLHAALVRLLDQLLHVGVGAEVGIDLGEVGDPVAVVAGALVALRALDGPVLERRSQPNRGTPQVLDVVQLRGQPLEIPAVVETLVAAVEPGLESSSGEPTLVVGRVPVGEAVAHHEVETFFRQQGAQGVTGQRFIGGGGCAGQIGRHHRDQVADVVVADHQLGGSGENERDVGAVGDSLGAVVLGPIPVDGHLELVAAGRDRERGPVDIRADHRQCRGLTRGLPIGRAPQLVLQRAGDCDRALTVIGQGWRGAQRGEDHREGGGNTDTFAERTNAACT